MIKITTLYKYYIVLTIMKANPRQQITKVFQTTCINAIKEKSCSMLSENEMTLLCFSTSIPMENYLHIKNFFYFKYFLYKNSINIIILYKNSINI